MMVESELHSLQIKRIILHIDAMILVEPFLGT